MPARVEYIKHPVRAALVLGAQFPNVVLLCAGDIRAVGEGQHRPFADEELDDEVDAVLLTGIEADPPIFEFIGEFDFPPEPSMTASE